MVEVPLFLPEHPSYEAEHEISSWLGDLYGLVNEKQEYAYETLDGTRKWSQTAGEERWVGYLIPEIQCFHSICS